MAKDPIKKAGNGTYYFRANLGYHPVTGKQIQKYRSGFTTKKEAREEYSKLILSSIQELEEKKKTISFQKFIEETYLPWYKTQVDFWTLEEFQKVISLLYKGDYYEHYLFISFWLLFMTGMRIGEAAALLWSDIDFDTGLLSITKTMYYKSMDNFKPVEPKTQASIRTIYIDTDTIRELMAWQEVQKKVLNNCDFVLSYNGIPTSKHTLPRALEKLAELAGVHRIKIHALRHSHASLLISMGENPLLIKERLGHEKIQTTLGTYGHLYPNTNLEVANKLTGILRYTPATQGVADYTSNQHTAAYHKEVK